MKNRITRPCLVMVVLGLAWLFSGCASTNTLAVQQAGYTKEQVDVRGLYTENCAACHGKDGRARTIHGWLVGAQNFTDAHWLASDAEIIHAIQTGPRVMPAFQKKLSVNEIEVLAAYVRTFQPAL